MATSFTEKYQNEGKILKTMDEYKRTKWNELIRKLVEVSVGSNNSIKIFNHWVKHVLPKQIEAQSFITDTKRGDQWKILFGPPESGKEILSNPVDDQGYKRVPKWCRDHNFPYRGELTINCKVMLRKKGEKDFTVIKNIDKLIGYIPIMLGSEKCNLYGMTPEQLASPYIGECISDPFGYFIIKSERTLITKDKLRLFIPFVYLNKKGNYECYYTGSGPRGTFKHILRTGKDTSAIKVKKIAFLRKRMTDGKVRVEQIKESRTDKSLPLFIIFRYLLNKLELNGKGNNVDLNDIIDKYILIFVPEDMRMKIRDSLEESIINSKRYRDDQLVAYIAKKKQDPYSQAEYDYLRDYYREQLVKNLFYDIEGELLTIPKFGTDEYFSIVNRKLYQLGYITVKYLLVLNGDVEPDSRDTWANKAFDTPADSMMILFWRVFEGFVRSAKYEILDDNYEEFPNKLGSVKKQDQITSQFESWFSGGNGADNDLKEVNKTEQTKRDTPLNLWSQADKTNPEASRKGKNTDIRDVNGSQRDYHCIFETPESEAIGLVKHFAITCNVSINEVGFNIPKIIRENGKRRSDKYDYYPMVNGIGVYDNEELLFVKKSFAYELRKMKRSLQISRYTEIFVNDVLKTIEIFTTNGRPMVPYFVIEDDYLVIEKLNAWDWDLEKLYENRCIELVAPREKENDSFVVAYSVEKFLEERKTSGERVMTPFGPVKTIYTHCVIDPIQMLSLSVSINPYLSHYPGPKISTQSSMIKQALGEFNINYQNSFMKSFKRLTRTERALCETDVAHIPKADIMPPGQIAFVLFATDPDNQEDSVVVSEDFLNSGKYTYVRYSTIRYEPENKGIADVEEVFKKPTLSSDEDPHQYDAIGEDGMPILDRYVNVGDCIIGKVSVNINDKSERNSSKFTQLGEEGYVDRVLITQSRDNNRVMIKIRLRKTLTYRTGDKMAIRAAQKGTIARVAKREELPVVVGGPNDGMRPDIIFNPHGFPSRKSVGMLYEGIRSKASLYDGKRCDATAFRSPQYEYAKSVLRENGMDEEGYEYFKYPNDSKDEPPRKLFFVPLFEQILRHQVLEKIQVRGATGYMNILSRQPVKGRRNEGGQRFGEMETAALESHGAANNIQERVLEVSDKFGMVLCINCGIIVSSNMIKPSYEKCDICGKNELGILNVPFSFKSMVQLLFSAGIFVKFNTKVKKEDYC